MDCVRLVRARCSVRAWQSVRVRVLACESVRVCKCYACVFFLVKCKHSTKPLWRKISLSIFQNFLRCSVKTQEKGLTTCKSAYATFVSPLSQSLNYIPWSLSLV